MEVAFKTKKLRKCFLNFEEAKKAYGDQVARKFIQRVNIIRTADTLETLTALPSLHCHQLKGKRKGQWAMKLTARYRLIFRVEEDSSVRVLVLEVSNHYGD